MKKQFITIVLSIILTLLVIGVIMEIIAQRKEWDRYDAIEVIESEILEESRTLLLHLPERYNVDKGRIYPVIFALDGGSHSYWFSNAAAILNAAELLPEAIIVAIPNTDRNRDLTPNYILQDTDGDQLGKGDVFLAFLEEEVVPFIEEKYRTNGHRVLSGHSRAGLFSMFALLEKPSLFNGYFCISPAFWRDEQIIVEKTAAFLEQQDSLDRFLFLSLGSEENEKMKKGYDDMIQVLQSGRIANLQIFNNYTPRANHQTNLYYSIPLGLKYWNDYYKYQDTNIYQ